MHEKTLKLPGAVNLRDFGGYATVDGWRVVRHRLYRSGSLAHLAEEARDTFSQLGVSLICDLRREEERSGEPTPTFNHPVRKLEIPIHPGNTGRLKEIARKREPSLQERIEYMVEINRQLARDHTEDYARMFDALLELEEGAFLVHCSAGKDRTGFACALILHALGVPEETVLEDYLFTNEALDMDGYMIPLLLRHRAEVPEDRDTLLAILGVRREYLQGALDTIEEEFEGVEEYLRNVIGLDDGAREILRNRYLE